MPLPAVIHCTSPAAMAPWLPMLSPCSTVPGKNVGDGLDAAVGMPGEAGQIILGNVVAEVVEQQERVEIGSVAETECAAQVHARAFQGRLGFDQPLYGSKGHISSLPWERGRAGLLRYCAETGRVLENPRRPGGPPHKV